MIPLLEDKYRDPADPITFDEYQREAVSYATYPDQGKNFVYPILGLAGETGEVAEKVKKIVRDKGGIVSDEDREAIKKELSDVLWYVSQEAFELGFTLESVARAGLEKLSGRKQRGTLQGSGDDR